MVFLTTNLLSLWGGVVEEHAPRYPKRVRIQLDVARRIPDEPPDARADLEMDEPRREEGFR
jgi:hypothetical protein